MISVRPFKLLKTRLQDEFRSTWNPRKPAAWLPKNIGYYSILRELFCWCFEFTNSLVQQTRQDLSTILWITKGYAVIPWVVPLPGSSHQQDCYLCRCWEGRQPKCTQVTPLNFYWWNFKKVPSLKANTFFSSLVFMWFFNFQSCLSTFQRNFGWRFFPDQVQSGNVVIRV